MLNRGHVGGDTNATEGNREDDEVVAWWLVDGRDNGVNVRKLTGLELISENRSHWRGIRTMCVSERVGEWVRIEHIDETLKVEELRR